MADVRNQKVLCDNKQQIGWNRSNNWLETITRWSEIVRLDSFKEAPLTNGCRLSSCLNNKKVSWFADNIRYENVVDKWTVETFSLATDNRKQVNDIFYWLCIKLVGLFKFLVHTIKIRTVYCRTRLASSNVEYSWGFG